MNPEIEIRMNLDAVDYDGNNINLKERSTIMCKNKMTENVEVYPAMLSFEECAKMSVQR